MTDSRFHDGRQQDGFDSPFAPDPQARRGADTTVEQFRSSLAGLELRLKEHIDNKVHKLREEFRQDMKDMVPDGDIPGHKSAHVTLINSARRWDNFKFSLFEHLVKAGGLGLAIYISMAIYDAFKRGVAQ